jgi:hypothetical protein
VLTIGTKSVLFGAHCFFIHPFCIALAWWKLYGFPWDIRLWFAFFLHDIGYIGKPNMDGPEGEKHPELGAESMRRLFDDQFCRHCGKRLHQVCSHRRWYDFCLYHSRHYAKLAEAPFSRLCVADKLVLSYEIKWLYLLRVKLSGEMPEYLANAKHGRGEVSDRNPSEWFDTLRVHLAKWAYAHRDCQTDDTTPIRNAA